MQEETKRELAKNAGASSKPTWNFVKKLVSTNKFRFVGDGFDLDLSYIRPNLIAMGFPSQGFESIYRNSLVDTRNFLDMKHSNHYKIYNLCIEKDRKYDFGLFPSGKISFDYLFYDHNPPPFEMIYAFCHDI